MTPVNKETYKRIEKKDDDTESSNIAIQVVCSPKLSEETNQEKFQLNMEIAKISNENISKDKQKCVICNATSTMKCSSCKNVF